MTLSTLLKCILIFYSGPFSAPTPSDIQALTAQVATLSISTAEAMDKYTSLISAAYARIDAEYELIQFARNAQISLATAAGRKAFPSLHLFFHYF